jgi:transposase InsO family protein
MTASRSRRKPVASVCSEPLPAAGRHHHPLRPRSAVRVLGIHPAREGLRPAALDGLHRGLRGQRDDGVLLGPGPGRTPRPQTVAHRLELSTALFEYLEIFHNRQRRHSALGMLSPVEYELRTPPVA